MSDPPARAPHHGRRTLWWRVFLGNSAVLLAAAVALAISPVTVSFPIVLAEAVPLALGFALLVFVNLVSLRRAFAPLERLADEMHQVDLLRPGRRVKVHGDYEEVVRLTHAFNQMLERIEEERRHSVRAALGAQESERRRVAQELHDEIGQSLTAITLRLQAALRDPGEISRRDLLDVQVIAERSVDGVREIARRLRPEMLDDLGLPSALVALTEQVAETTGMEVRRSLQRELPPFDPEVDLVVYRVAQESLTNVVRHSSADVATVALAATGDGVTLTVEDNGHGMNGARVGTGIQGMRERAVLIGGTLTVEDAPAGGVRVCLRAPAGVAAADGR